MGSPATADAGPALAAGSASGSGGVGATSKGSSADQGSEVVRSVVDMVEPVPQTSPGAAGTASLGTLCVDERKAKDFENMVNLVLVSGAFPEKPAKQEVKEVVKTCLLAGAVQGTRDAGRLECTPRC